MAVDLGSRLVSRGGACDVRRLRCEPKLFWPADWNVVDNTERRNNVLRVLIDGGEGRLLCDLISDFYFSI